MAKRGLMLSRQSFLPAIAPKRLRTPLLRHGQPLKMKLLATGWSLFGIHSKIIHLACGLLAAAGMVTIILPLSPQMRITTAWLLPPDASVAAGYRAMVRSTGKFSS